MANFHLRTIWASLWFNLYAIYGQTNRSNTSVVDSLRTDAPTGNPSPQPTIEDESAEPLSIPLIGAWDKDNILIIIGAAVVTLIYCLCITLTVLYVVKNKKRSNANQSVRISIQSHKNAAHHQFTKQQIREMNRIVANGHHRRETNFTDPRHISAYNALQFCPPINHNGANWKQLDHVNSQQRFMELSSQQRYIEHMANQTAMAMEYFMKQQEHILAKSAPQPGFGQKLSSYSFEDANDGKYSPINAPVKAHSAQSAHSPFNNKHLAPAGSPPLHAIDLDHSAPRSMSEIDDEVIANSGDLPESMASGQSMLSMYEPGDAFKFDAQKHSGIAEDVEIKKKYNRRQMPPLSSAAFRDKINKMERSRDPMRPAKRPQANMVLRDDDEDALPDLPESTFNLNAHVQ